LGPSIIPQPFFQPLNIVNNPESNEILLNMGTKCWNLRLNAQALKVFTILIHTTIEMITLKQSRKKKAR
jgi:hypothetical protein